MKRLLSRVRWLALAPALAIIALLAWGFASPIGASPDDDFHLVSTWCASASSSAHCEPGTDATSRRVPKALVTAGCYLPDARTSAACVNRVDFDPSHLALTQRGNFVGGYPPLYYATMGLFVGPNILVSIVLMRVATILIFVGITTALFLLLPLRRRSTLLWTWLITSIPLGMFLLASNNPSSWAIIGVGTAWLALLGFLETRGRQKIGLGIVFVAASLIGAGARGDAAVYLVLSYAVALFLAWRRDRRLLLDSILPVVMAIVCVYFFITANQVVSGLNGFGGTDSGGSAAKPRTLVGLLGFNLINVPSLWAGVFGSWGLGWLEVGMPAIVAVGSLACFIVAGTVGFGTLGRRKSLALAAVGLALIVVPVFVLTRGGDLVGEQVQPRYLLPLIVLLGGVLMLDARGRAVRFTRAQTILVGATLVVAQLVALETTMRRYITGNGVQGLDLDAGAKWWWSIPFSPMVVFVVGSLAFAGLVWILLREVSRGRSSIRGLSAEVTQPEPIGSTP